MDKIKKLNEEIAELKKKLEEDDGGDDGDTTPVKIKSLAQDIRARRKLEEAYTIEKDDGGLSL